MARLTFLQRARDAGLEVFADGGELVVRGPKSEERLAMDLLGKKPAVLAELLASARPEKRFYARRAGRTAVARPAGGGSVEPGRLRSRSGHTAQCWAQ